MSSRNASSRLYGASDPFNVVNSDEDMSTEKTMVEKMRKKKKRGAKDSKKGPNVKKSKTNTTAAKQTEAWKEGGATIPPVVEEPRVPPVIEEEVLQPQYTPSVRRPPLSARYWKSLLPKTEADRLRLMSTVMMNCVKRSRDLRPNLENCKRNSKNCDLLISKEDLNKWCASFWWRLLSSGGMATAGPGEELEVPEVFDEYLVLISRKMMMMPQRRETQAILDQVPSNADGAVGANEKEPPVEGTFENHPEIAATVRGWKQAGDGAVARWKQAGDVNGGVRGSGLGLLLACKLKMMMVHENSWEGGASVGWFTAARRRIGSKVVMMMVCVRLLRQGGLGCWLLRLGLHGQEDGLAW
ncbi:OLC1v1024370C1 [Oldenlandia corymbosa var. corymbosa]|uniref:OLC1v1024370C1 n=1 Tax=Oldenlandia corymbosa var. corymbosa TaxID=529605 RepID=A0AAV1C4Z7_OLDCO|nr:OLC1v1024370C1 [Oldenlandia corymbosa var. corymbosa]